MAQQRKPTAAQIQAASRILSHQHKRTYAKGVQGATVRALQIFLASKGYEPGKFDGIWGKRTQAAFDAYQKAEGKHWGRATPVALQHIANDITGADKVPMPRLRPEPPAELKGTASIGGGGGTSFTPGKPLTPVEPMEAHGRLGGGAGMAVSGALDALPEPEQSLGAANSPLALEDSYRPLEDRPVYVPDFGFAGPLPQPSPATPPVPGSERVLGMFTPEARQQFDAAQEQRVLDTIAGRRALEDALAARAVPQPQASPPEMAAAAPQVPPPYQPDFSFADPAQPPQPQYPQPAPVAGQTVGFPWGEQYPSVADMASDYGSAGLAALKRFLGEADAAPANPAAEDALIQALRARDIRFNNASNQQQGPDMARFSDLQEALTRR